MAKATAGGSGEWTAGIIAIVAALLIGAGVPVALYYTLYLPRTETHDAEKKKQQVQLERQMQLANLQAEVDKYVQNSKQLEGRLALAEEKFTPPALMARTIKRLQQLSVQHELKLRKEHQLPGSPRNDVVREEAVAPVIMASGLRGTRVSVVGHATYHDLCRFIADIENQASGLGQKTAGSGEAPKDGDKPADDTPGGAEPKSAPSDDEILRKAVVIVESLSIQGDQNGGHRHNFDLSLVVIERRDVKEVGNK